jgi:hypothetical protein
MMRMVEKDSVLLVVFLMDKMNQTKGGDMSAMNSRGRKTLRFRSTLVLLLQLSYYYLIAVFTTRYSRWAAAVHRGEHHDIVGQAGGAMMVSISLFGIFHG